MLEIEALSAEAGTFRLNAVSLTVPRSSCHVIVGPTGGGKTLLLEAIVGLKRLVTGTIRRGGLDITSSAVEHRGLAYVPQDLALFPHMTVQENIAYGTKIRGRHKEAAQTITQKLIESTGIDHLMDRLPANLSGGERQRVALVRAVASGCRHLILDEPLSALHESLKKELWFLLKALIKDFDLAVLMVTHDLKEAFFLGDFISVIIGGSVHQQGGKMDLYHFPRTAAVAQFLGIRNIFEGTITRSARHTIVVSSRDLGGDLLVQRPDSRSNGWHEMVEGSKVLVGVRSAHVTALESTDRSQGSPNVVQGTLQNVFQTGTSSIAEVQVGQTGLIEMELSTTGIAGSGAFARGSRIIISLPPDKLFLIKK